MTDATALTGRVAALRRRVAQASAGYGRAPGSVDIVAVSKSQPVEAIAAALRAGLRRFGENYAQEALAKIADPRLAGRGIEWHFIGPVQSNKTRLIAVHFNWVHSIDRLNIAQRLSEQRPEQLAPLNVCLQVNVSGETTKAGTMLDALPGLARAVARLSRLRLRGLMTLPAPAQDVNEQRRAFHKLNQALHELNTQGLNLDTLSMGTSDDLEAAIAEGATLVRVGTAIFGTRSKIR
ncbi:MAG: YggS family pyridoxal phosphate-dependent enzyme [Gammaproteobacteria bacterium]|nr:MAG: YggS family pyridoxal phosphate-dependent enzyme [Gammaproteobacteria bacterium]